MARQPAGPQGVGTLFIVATPIGNLGDMTQRAVETLRNADLILAEDTRSARVLLEHFGIRRRAVSAHRHNEARVVSGVLDSLARGENVALVSDAGTPLISDPGSRIVQAARAAGYHVSPVPGPSALTAALSACGLDTQRFTFLGFLPRSGKERREVLGQVAGLTHTVVLYEAPGRVAATLGALGESGGEARGCVVAREISKLHEEFRDGTVGELAAYYAGHPPRGEVVILLAGAAPRPFNEGELRARVEGLRREGMSARDVAARLAAELGVPRNTVYRMALE